jgi:hypothetical protein
MRRANKTIINNNNNNNKNNNNKNSKNLPPFLPPSISDDIIAGRTRHQKMAIEAKWDLQTPIIIEIISWLYQESLMNLSLVSKQLHDIITNEPGNKNKIHPVVEVSGSSALKFCQNVQDHFRNKETKNKLQRYQIMKFKDLSKFKDDENIRIYHHLVEIAKNVQMNGITSLDLSSSSSIDWTGDTLLLRILSNILPNLHEVDFSNIGIGIGYMILKEFSNQCPLLEKVTSNNNPNLYHISGFEMRASNNLKEINMNNSDFIIYAHEREISDLNNYPDTFMFHHCCKALERVSIRNMKCGHIFDIFGDDDDDDDEDEEQKLIFTQNVLIKFVRNAPPTLHWFRSDLTQDNMTMLRMERPGIELLN